MEHIQKGVSGFQLKLFALAVMTLDHIHYFFPGMPMWLTYAGRLAAPVFLFLCVEGFGYTHSRPKYLARMYLFAVSMKFVSMLLTAAFPRADNVIIMNDMFSTMFVVCWCIQGIEFVRDKTKRKWGVLMLLGMLGATAFVMAGMLVPGWPSWLMKASFLLLPNPFTCEGSFLWVLLAVAFFYTRRRKRAVFLVMLLFAILHLGLGQLTMEYILYVGCTFAAIIPICLYNGTPGRHRCKWLFYCYYPAHVYVMYLISWALHF